MAITYFDVAAGSTLYIPFTSYDANGASVTLTGLAVTDIEIYKDGSVTQRASDAGYTLLDTDGIDFDGVTGLHGISIDLNDNTDAGFYAVGSQYWVVVSTVTISTQVVTALVACFRIVDAIDLSDVQSHLTKVYSDTTHIDSDVTLNESRVLIVKSDTSDIKSFLTVIDAKVSDIQSDTNVMVPIVSDIQSDTNVLVSQVLIVKSDTSDIKSFLTVIDAKVSDIQSDTNKLVSDATEVDTSDLHSLITLVRSDTAVIETVTSDIQSDTNVLITKARALVIATGTLGATGNTTTALHLDNAVFDSLSDNELNGYTVVIYDNSLDEYHTRTISAWANTGDLATVATLPFTPEASVDLYWVLPPQSQQTPELDGDVSDVLSRLTVTNSQVLIIKSDTSDIKSNLVIIASDAAAIDSNVDKVYSDTTAIHTQTTAIASDTTTLASDLAEADFSDIHSRLTLVLSDTSDIRSHLTAITGAAGVISDIASGVDAIQAAGAALTAAQDSKLTQIHSDTQPVGTLFEIISDIYSDTTVIEAGGGSLTATQASQLARVQSIAIVIEPYTSDTVSMVTVIKSDTSDIISRLVVINSETTDIQSETEVIQSQALVIKSDTSDIRSHLTVIHSETTAIQTKTDSLTFTQAGNVDANIQYVNDVAVTGTGALGDEWGPV